MQAVNQEMLETLAAMRPSTPPREEPRFSPGRNGYREFDLEAWIGEHGVPVKREGPWQRDGYRWVLQECPWNGHTDNAAYIVRRAGGAIAAGCHHNSCQGYGWRDLREHYEPGSYERNGHQAEDRLRECSRPVATLLSEVEPERIEWLWPGRIPLGKLTVLDGDPGLGKSAMTLDIAARVSAGLELPDGERCEPAGVLLMSAEDGLADTIRPRLDAAGADTKRILALTTKTDQQGAEQMVSIPEDLPLIEREIQRMGARLVVVDPLMAFLSGDTNSHKDQDVRRALAPLASLAQRTGAAVLIVRHLNKAGGGNTLYRGGGSIGIIGAARAALVVAEDPEDPERRILAHNKQNLCKPVASLAFAVETAPNRAARIAWRGQSELSASQILRPPVDEEEKSALSEAKEFLQDELRDGPMAAKQVKKNARDADIAERTLKRAKQELRVGSKKEGDGSWTWSLPSEEAKGGQPSTVGPVGPLGTLPINKPNRAENQGGQAETVGPLQNGPNSPYLSEGSQGGQGGHGQRCNHGYPDGAGCYLCDPEHPYRLNVTSSCDSDDELREPAELMVRREPLRT